MRIGQSIDIHRLDKGNHIPLGGVKIDCDFSMVAHSDGDALLHAISESILGALALGDLGHHFPDTDPKYKGISSMILLKEVAQLMEERNYEIGNIDSLIIIEKLKMAPYIEMMRENISKACNCKIDQVSVKATRGEKLGFVGESKGVVATAVVLLNEKQTI